MANCVPMGLEPAPLTWACDARQRATRHRVGTTQRTSTSVFGFGRLTQRVWPVAVGLRCGTSAGSFRSRALHRCRENGTLRCPAGSSLRPSELRQENAFTQRAVYAGFPGDCRACQLREQCLGRGAKGNSARRVSAVRRLLPMPASVERKPGVLQATCWKDVAGRTLRRTWTTHWRRQHVEVLPLAEVPKSVSPPARSPRAVRSHRR